MNSPIANASEAVAIHIEGLLDAGEKIPASHGVEAHSGNPDYAGMVWALVSVDLASLSRKGQTPEHLTSGAGAAPHRFRRGKNGETRSGFIARIALEAE